MKTTVCTISVGDVKVNALDECLCLVIDRLARFESLETNEKVSRASCFDTLAQEYNLKYEKIVY